MTEQLCASGFVASIHLISYRFSTFQENLFLVEDVCFHSFCVGCSTFASTNSSDVLHTWFSICLLVVYVCPQKKFHVALEIYKWIRYSVLLSFTCVSFILNLHLYFNKERDRETGRHRQILLTIFCFVLCFALVSPATGTDLVQWEYLVYICWVNKWMLKSLKKLNFIFSTFTPAKNWWLSHF